jgi:hypothetical protein
VLDFQLVSVPKLERVPKPKRLSTLVDSCVSFNIDNFVEDLNHKLKKCSSDGINRSLLNSVNLARGYALTRFRRNKKGNEIGRKFEKKLLVEVAGQNTDRALA